MNQFSEYGLRCCCCCSCYCDNNSGLCLSGFISSREVIRIARLLPSYNTTTVLVVYLLVLLGSSYTTPLMSRCLFSLYLSLILLRRVFGYITTYNYLLHFTPVQGNSVSFSLLLILEIITSYLWQWSLPGPYTYVFFFSFSVQHYFNGVGGINGGSNTLAYYCTALAPCMQLYIRAWSPQV